MCATSTGPSKWLVNTESVAMRRCHLLEERKEGNVYVLFNEALNTFYLWLYFVKHMIKEHSGRKEMFYLTMHSTHFIYGYMASGTW